ncbi:MAG: 50S ribosomal protein L1 [candidate division Zixibacteria bacterium SM23_73_3]|nr:MAG: 50S ribosomal protein L1 [candidate division Zixibacteria bacterium SM23_73_3]
MKRGKNYKQAKEKVGKGKSYKLEEAIKKLKDSAYAKFDETVEVSMRLGVDPKHADQMVRGTTLLPNGTGKKVKVLVLTKGEKEKEANEAGADFVGLEEYIEKITQGWLDVDVVVATPDVMGQVGKLGKILGTKRMMPNPKSGTVTFDVAKTVRELKTGKIEFRVDKGGNISAPIGKLSFTEEQLVENAKVFLDVIIRAKPTSAKGTYLKSAFLSSTMGPGIRLDTSSVLTMLKQ